MLALMLSGGLLMAFGQEPMRMMAWVMLALGCVCALWILAAFVINLLYKHKKRKGA